MQANDAIQVLRPFLGRILLEAIEDSADSHLKDKLQDKVSKEFLDKFVMTETKNKKVSISKGKIVKMAQDSFGQAYKNIYGSDHEVPEVGDVLYFVPNQSYQFDSANKYHLIAENDIVGYIKGKDYDTK